jgi:hypothetical protein
MQRTADLLDAQDTAIRPLRPGFPDRLLELGRLDTRRGWLLFVAVAAGVALTYWAIKVFEGTLPDQARFMHLALPAFAFAGVPALAAFNTLARRSLAAARPLLRGDATDHARLERRLTTMPSSLVAVAAAIGLLALVGLTILQPANTNDRLQIMVTPISSVVEWLFQLLTWSGVGIVGVEIARKLWVIDDIYRRHMRINVLKPGALSGFARLAAAMVMFTMAAVILSTIALADFASTLAWSLMTGIPSVLALVAFVAPLWGGHRLIAAEKARNVDELGERIEVTIAALRSRVDADELDRVAPLKDALEGLIAARHEYLSVSTWPWQRTTLGGVITAVIAPLAVWLVTRVLERLTVA